MSLRSGGARRRAFTLVEALVAVALATGAIGLLIWLLVFGGRSSERITPQLALQQESRKAVVRFLKELQEGMEVISPRPGSTLTYALVRDRVARVRWFYQVPGSTRGLFDLVRYVDDAKLAGAERLETLLTRVRRLTFTARGEGLVQVNLLLADGEQEYALLTTIRLRNLASTEEIW